MNTYMGGGYVFRMKMSDNSLGTGKIGLKFNLNTLKAAEWIDRQTRAVFVEFTLYNPNLNLFSYCLILFEVLPTGSLISTSEFKPINLFDISDKNSISFKLIINIIYMILICLYMINEIKLILRERKEYFKQFYNYIELLIIAFSWAAFTMYLYRLYSSYKIFDSINKSAKSVNGIMDVSINLQYLSYCNDLLIYFMGFCAAFGTIRFIKLLRFNKKVIIFALAFKSSLKELASFLLIFFIVWLAFVQVIYLIFNDKSIQFATILSCMETLFQLILGKFQVSSMISAHAFFGSLFYVAYNIMIVFLLINIFVSILIDNYNLIRKNDELDIHDPNVFEYIKSVIYSRLGFNKKHTKNKKILVYVDTLSSFSKTVDKFINKLNMVKFDLYIYIFFLYFNFNFCFKFKVHHQITKHNQIKIKK